MGQYLDEDFSSSVYCITDYICVRHVKEITSVQVKKNLYSYTSTEDTQANALMVISLGEALNPA